MSKNEARREVRPDEIKYGNASGMSEIPDGDPNYTYRYVGKDAMEKLARRKEQGWQIAHDGYTMVKIGMPKEQAQAIQKGYQKKSEDRLLAERADAEARDSIQVEKRPMHFEEASGE